MTFARLLQTSLRVLASLRLTLVGIPLLAVAAFIHSRPDRDAVPLLLIALSVLSANLLAALIVRRGFRRQHGLLVFHLALLAIMLLSMASVMTRLQGRFELVEGQRFDPASVEVTDRGAWHAPTIPALPVTQGRIEVDFEDGTTRRSTRSTLEVAGASAPDQRLIGDTRGLSIDGYRWVTSSNKGYAVILDWQDAGGVLRGALHMPAFPLFEWKQQQRWRTPAGQWLDVQLDVAPATGRGRWTLQSAGVDARLVVRREGSGSHTLHVGESVRVDAGTLRFAGIRLWMGYRLDYDPLLPWMLSVALLGVAGLSGHFLKRYGAVSIPRVRPTAEVDDDVTDNGNHTGTRQAAGESWLNPSRSG